MVQPSAYILPAILQDYAGYSTTSRISDHASESSETSAGGPCQSGYRRTCIHTCIHTYVRTYIHTYIPTYVRTNIHTYIHTYIHKHIHYIHYIHYIHCMHAMHTYLHAYLTHYITQRTKASTHCLQEKNRINIWNHLDFRHRQEILTQDHNFSHNVAADLPEHEPASSTHKNRSTYTSTRMDL